MAKYKAIKSIGTAYKGSFKIKWSTASQEELAYAYEELGMTDTIEKISNTTKKDEPKKKSSKKSSKNKSKN